jgi:hypothetical protein
MTTNRQHLRLVRRPPEPRHFHVRISAFSARGGPFGRSQAFRLDKRDLDELIEHAARLEKNRGRQ